MAGVVFGEVGGRCLWFRAYATTINNTYYFSWQEQHLVRLEGHFSWQAQYSVKFEKIAGAQNVVIFNTKCIIEARKVTSANGRVRDDEFMLGSCSDHGRIGRALALALQSFSENFA